jgi:hypothetical protein
MIICLEVCRHSAQDHCPETMCSGMHDLFQPPDNLEFFKDPLSMGGIDQLRGEVLPGPVLVVAAIAPEAALGHVIDEPLVGDPDLLAVLPIAQAEL